MTPKQQQEWMDEQIEHLKTLKDEIRLNLHLATLELKSRWLELEPRFEEVEKLASDVSDISKKAVTELTDKFRSFLDVIKRPHPPVQPPF